MRIYNTLTDKTEPFKPRVDNTVSMYVCGPTVYNYIHIGNARPVIFFDVVRRTFEHLGYTVHFVSNFTDVDDKIITKAIEDETSEAEVAAKFITAFLEDVARVGSQHDYLAPRVTKYMDSIIQYISRLIDQGSAYEIDGDVYFDVNYIEDYGILSNRNVDDQEVGARIEANPKKRNPLDFTLWKKTPVGVTYPSPWGEGRPGWHTECVAMIEDIFGGRIDIHGGGTGLMFPHHENEIAQSKALHGHAIANVWMHSGHLRVGDKKMSKSEGEIILVKDLDVDYMGFRLYMLSNYYRAPIHYTDEALKSYVQEWDKVKRAYTQAFYRLDLAEYLDNPVNEDVVVKEIYNAFIKALKDDFNTPNAITQLQALTKLLNQRLRQDDDLDALLNALSMMNVFFDILGLSIDLMRLNKADRNMYMEWADARRNKDYDKADRLRASLTERGILA